MDLEGPVDIAVVPELRARLRDATTAPKESLLVLDLSRVTLLDASAMGVIAGAAKAYGEVELRSPCPVIRKALDAGGLTQVVRVS